MESGLRRLSPRHSPTRLVADDTIPSVGAHSKEDKDQATGALNVSCAP
jgi:hypothetical protein